MQAAIDLAAHIVASEGYGLPEKQSEAFTLLEKEGILESELGERLRKMVGFRNIAIHNYQELDPQIVEAIVRKHLDDLRGFTAAVVRRFELDRSSGSA